MPPTTSDATLSIPVRSRRPCCRRPWRIRPPGRTGSGVCRWAALGRWTISPTVCCIWPPMNRPSSPGVSWSLMGAQPLSESETPSAAPTKEAEYITSETRRWVALDVALSQSCLLEAISENGALEINNLRASTFLFSVICEVVMKWTRLLCGSASMSHNDFGVRCNHVTTGDESNEAQDARPRDRYRQARVARGGDG